MAAFVRVSKGVVSALLPICICLSSAKAGSQFSPYDLGYAYQASQKCAGFVMLEPVPDTAKASSQFAEGVAMVDGMLARLSQERTCQFARSLYDAETGKVAKLLKIE